MNNEAVLFDISDQGLKAVIPFGKGGEALVPVNDYRAIVADESKEVMGVRKCDPKFGDNPTGVITNEEALQTMQDLFYHLFHEKGQIMYSYPDQKPDNWSVIMMGSTTVDMNSWLYRYLNLASSNKNVRPDSQNNFSRNFLESLQNYHEKQTGIESFVFDEKNDLLTSLSNYSIVLAMKNGYDFGDEMHFYLLIKVKDSVPNFRLNDSNLLQGEFLTLSSFSFHMSKFGKKIHEQVGSNAPILSDIVQANAVAHDFEKSLEEFARVYEGLHSIYADLDELIAITLDILNLNRNDRRLKYDKKQKSVIRERLNNLTIFYSHPTRDTLASILEYIFKSVRIDIGDYRPLHDNIQSILTKKDSYKSVTDFFYDLIGEQEKYDDYREAQLLSLKIIRQVLGGAGNE